MPIITILLHQDSLQIAMSVVRGKCMPLNKLQTVACQPYVYEIIGCLDEKVGQTQQSQEPNLNV